MKAIYLFIALFIFCNFAFAQNQTANEEVVVKAVAPNAYPVAAIAVKADG